MMGPVYTQTGQFDEALACYAKAREADPNSKFVDSFEAMTLAFAGRRAEAEKMLEEISRRAATDYISPASIAYIYTALGENSYGSKETPREFFDSLRTDVRYRALLKKMQLDD